MARSTLALAKDSSNWGLLSVVLSISIPVVITNTLQTIVGLVDTKMVGDPFLMGKEADVALAGVGVARVAVWLIFSILISAGVGGTAYIARYYGAKRHEEVKIYSTALILLAVFLGVSLGIFGLSLGKLPFVKIAATPTILNYSYDYMFVTYIGMAILASNVSVITIFNALARTVYPMYLLVINNVFNFIGNLILIPRMGVGGCALSTVLTTLIVVIIGSFILHRQRILIGVSRLGDYLVPMKNMFLLGLPFAIQMGIRASAFMLLYVIIRQLTDLAGVGQSALAVGSQAEALAYMPGLAFATAASTLVGQSLGMEDTARAIRSGWLTITLAVIVMTVVGVLFFVFAEEFVAFFTTNVSVIKEGAGYMRISAVCEPFLGVAMVSSGVLRGAGDTISPLFIGVFALWGIRLPLAYVLAVSFGFGLAGVWWAMTVSVILEATLLSLKFIKGNWKYIKLREG